MHEIIKRGDMYYANFERGIGSEQYGLRPVLIIQNDIGNKYSSTVIVAIITSKVVSKATLPTHYLIKAQQGLVNDSLILLEQIRTIDKARLLEYIGTLGDEDMNKIDEALAVSVGLKKSLPPKREPLVRSLCPYCEADFRSSGYLLVKRGWQEVKTNCDFCQTRKGLLFSIIN